jgi:Tol biopolymer transport system component
MNDSIDHELADWLHEGPESGQRDGLDRALAATRRVGQRPGWTLPERWIPLDMTMTQARVHRPAVAIVTLAMLVVALLAAAIYIGSERNQPRPLFTNGAVVYAENGDLFIVDRLGGAPRPLVTGPDEDSGPAFSPQGDRIAFVRGSRHEVERQIMTVRPDGSDVAELAAVDSVWVALAWAPDGSVLLASGERRYCCTPTRGELLVGPGSRRLYVVKSDGSGSRLLEPGPGVVAGTGAWRPDGRHIAFIGWLEKSHVADVYVADSNGRNVRGLQIESVTESDELEWSPDGTHLSLIRADDGAKISIADIDTDGTLTGVRRLTTDPGSTVELDQTWSPDGRQLAYLLAQDSTSRVAIVNADGSGHRLVGPTLAYRPMPDFGHDYILDTDGYFQDTDGHVRQLWQRPANDLTWAPDGRSLVVSGDVADDPATRIESWQVDVATGEQTEVQTPVDSWQRLAP